MNSQHHSQLLSQTRIRSSCRPSLPTMQNWRTAISCKNIHISAIFTAVSCTDLTLFSMLAGAMILVEPEWSKTKRVASFSDENFTIFWTGRRAVLILQNGYPERECELRRHRLEPFKSKSFTVQCSKLSHSVSNTLIVISCTKCRSLLSRYISVHMSGKLISWIKTKKLMSENVGGERGAQELFTDVVTGCASPIFCDSCKVECLVYINWTRSVF